MVNNETMRDVPTLRASASASAAPGSALVVLLARRPDLTGIDLSCENSGVPMPYADLVIEILEQAAGGQPYLDIPQGNHEAIVEQLDRGTVSSALVDGLRDIHPRLTSDATVETLSPSRSWSVRDGARRFGIEYDGDSLSVESFALQTVDTAADLAAAPAHTNVAAYARLKTAVHPWQLPFDLWTEEARVYLAHLGIPLHRLQSTFYRGLGWQIPELIEPTARRWHTAAERLGLTAAEVELIFGPSKGIDLWRIWGFRGEQLSGYNVIPDPADATRTISAGYWLDVLTGRVDVLLQQSGLTYDQLRQALDMRFVNTNDDDRRIVAIQLGSVILGGGDRRVLNCDLSLARLVRLVPESPGDLSGVLDRLHRFIRLWQKLGWTMQDVDRALCTYLPWRPESGEQRYFVFGQVRDAQNRPVFGFRVIASVGDVTLGSRLGEARSGDDGFYTITIPESRYRVTSAEARSLLLIIEDPAGVEIDGVFQLDGTAGVGVSNEVNIRITSRDGRPFAQFGASGELGSLSLGDVQLIMPYRLEWTRSALDQHFRVLDRYQDLINLSTASYADYRAEATPQIKSLYESLFLDSRLGDPPPALRLRAQGREIVGAGEDPRPFLSHIAAACGLSVGAVGELIAAGETHDGGPMSLSLRALTWLFFVGRTLVGSSISVWEYLQLRKLFRGNARSHTAAAAVVQVLRSRGLSPAETVYLLTHRRERDDTASEQEIIAVALAALRSALQTANTETAGLSSEERRRRLTGVVEQSVAADYGFDSKTASRALNEWLKSASADSTAKAIDDFLDPDFVAGAADGLPRSERFPRQFQTCARLSKLATLASMLGLTAESLGWLFAPGSAARGWLDPNTLPVVATQPDASLHGLLRLVRLVEVRDEIPGGESTLAQIFTLAGDTSTTALQVHERLCAITGWNIDDLQELLSERGFNLTEAEPLKEALGHAWLLYRLIECFAVIRRLGASAAQCLRWTAAEIGPEEAGEIIRLARSRHDAEGWGAVAKPLRDSLREGQRQALVSYLIANQQLRDSKDLYSRYLIDVEMSPCAQTTRIKQACASIQLFVQRCLLNLEPQVPPSAIDTQQWGWMRNYRVWEANRKVFLYPENWLEPELRTDKTPFFEEMESALLQDDVRSETGEERIRAYLSNLASISKLEIRCICNEPETNDVRLLGRSLHMLARTFSEPHKYFHRLRDNDAGIWAPWRQLNQDLGDHVVLAANNQNLYAFWFSFTEESTPGAQDGSGDTTWSIRLNWMSCINGKWQPRNSSSSTIETDLSSKSVRKDDFMFFKSYGAPYDRKILFIDCYAPFQLLNAERDVVRRPLGYFSVSFDNMSIESGQFPGNTIFGTNINRFRTIFQQQAYREIPAQSGQQGNDALSMYYPVGNPVTSVRVVNALSRTPARFSLAGVDPLETHSSLVRMQPFVFQDGGTIDGSIDRSGGHVGTVDSGAAFVVLPVIKNSTPLFSFSEHYHPSVKTFVAEMADGGVSLLLEQKSQESAGLNTAFVERYGPDAGFVNLDKLGRLVDFRVNGSYAIYNWELFFHSVLLIADNLSRNQRFEEARRWFHYIFDPTSDSDGSGPGRYWRFLPFREAATPTPVNELLLLLQADPQSPEDQRRRDELLASIADWKRNPFDPHRIARLRPSAYQWTVVMKYLDNLIAWGDQLFRRDTIESINEATQLYLLAADILGPRPRRVTMGGRTRPLSYATIASSLDEFSNVLVQAEALVRGPGDSGVTGASPTPSMMTVFAPYFCIPRNDKLEGYWDLVENRLFKIRHCMNIEGVVRQLPLYEPPIDPGLLVRARAAGVDLGAVLSDTALPVPAYRFDVLSRRATELCAEVRSLGSVLLSAIEKQDAEHLTLMRAEHEAALLALVEDVRQAQLDEARSGRESLLASRQTAVNRFVHYERMLGVETPRTPQEGENIQPLPAPQKATVLEQDGTKLIDSEREEFARLSAANDLQVAAGTADVLASYFRLIPDFTIGFSGSGTTFGGSFLGSAASMYAGLFRAGATQASYEASRAGRLAGLTFRENDWVLQRNQAALEIMQIDRQLIATDIRIDIAKKELRNHRKQIANSQAVENYLRDKFSNKALYGWMAGQVSSIHFQAYQLAYDIARRAEKAYRHELGLNDGETHFIQFGYWDSLRKGLLAGDRLAHDIKRMETAYLDHNRRELEITRHVSLRQLDPAALLSLRVTGTCDFALPEWLFDLDFPGHYFRRIKTVSVSLPCIVGPYTSVSGTLTLLSSAIRAKPARTASGEDPNKRVSYLPIQSIATSTAQNDSGLFELNFRDERYLPFEGAGAESTWRFQLPKQFRAFDYATISDLVLHLRYTARDGGQTLRDAAQAAVAADGDFIQLLSLKQDFAAELAARGANATSLTLTLGADLRPYICRTGFELKDEQVHLWKRGGAVDGTAYPVSKENGKDTVVLTISDADLALDPHLLLHFVKPAQVH